MNGTRRFLSRWRIVCRFWMLALAVVVTAPVHAAVTDAAAAGFGVVHERTVPLPPERAWAVYVDEVGRWWNPDHSWFGDAAAFSIDARGGGCFCEDGPRGSVEHMRVGMAVPGHSLALLGGLGPLQPLGVAGAMSIEFAAAEGEQGAAVTRVRLVYRVSGYAAEGLERWAGPVDGVLGEQLDRYAAHAASVAAAGRPD